MERTIVRFKVQKSWSRAWLARASRCERQTNALAIWSRIYLVSKQSLTHTYIWSQSDALFLSYGHNSCLRLACRSSLCLPVYPA